MKSSASAPLVVLPDPGHPVIVQARAMRAIVEQARRIAGSKVGVLIEGESGTGKELLARIIHQASPRAAKPFIGVNCAALSESLVESELFGHEKGAFTGAEESRLGRFERAQGGTLLLDEISEMPVRLQAKLLRVLEEEEFERVGGQRTLKSDVRILATTNRCLEADGSGFRRDLYYRLNTIHFRLPPLRSRPDDIPALVDHFFERFRQEAAQTLDGVTPEAMDRLVAFPWPGNVRQLRNVLQRACLLAAGPQIVPGDLPLAIEAGEANLGDGSILKFPSRSIDDMERQAILEALRETGGNKTAAARNLGVTARTLHNKLKRYAQNRPA